MSKGPVSPDSIQEAAQHNVDETDARIEQLDPGDRRKQRRDRHRHENQGGDPRRAGMAVRSNSQAIRIANGSPIASEPAVKKTY